MNQLFIILFMVLVGCLVALQGVVNSALGKHLEEPIHAALVSFGVGFFCLCMLTAFLTDGFPNVKNILSASPILLVGGVMGVIFVTSTIIFVPKIGIANVIVAALCGQIILSLIADHYGFLGLKVDPINAYKIIGSVLIVAGLVLINYKNI